MTGLLVAVIVVTAVNLLSLAGAYIIAGIKGRPYRLVDELRIKGLLYAGAIGYLAGRGY